MATKLVIRWFCDFYVVFSGLVLCGKSVFWVVDLCGQKKMLIECF